MTSINVISDLQDISNLLRRDSIEMTTSAGSGHPTSCLSCAEIMSCLWFNAMKYNCKDANDQDNDEFILSKGHAAPIYYSSLKRAGLIKQNLMDLRKLNSSLEGHPIPHNDVPWIKVATGSLGQGLSIGIGMTLAQKIQKRKSKTYVLLGDSECAEGSVWEALQLAPHYNLNNLIAIIDINLLGQTSETILGKSPEKYKKILENLGWNSIVINGHDIKQILNALEKANYSLKPTAILALTTKGKGVSFIENKQGWHGRALSKRELEWALEEIPNPKMPKFNISKPTKTEKTSTKIKIPNITKYKEREVSTREAFGNALAELAFENKNIIALDAEVGNSTKSEKVKELTPNQFIQTYIAEQNMIGISLGLSKKGLNVFASTFSAFLTRAHDQLRMASYSRANMTICGSHSGVSIGSDGVSQMGLEDISMFRSFPNSIILYPSDAISCEKLTQQTLNPNLKGIKYIRTTRDKTPIIYHKREKFPIPGFKVLRQSKKDIATIIACGITLHEALEAYAVLKKRGIEVAVIDLYCIKPLDGKSLGKFISKHGKFAIVSEDHYPQGGIAESISSALANSNIKLKSLAINQIPHSGDSADLLDKYCIDYKAIIKALNL